jgi:hypothetical protein
MKKLTLCFVFVISCFSVAIFAQQPRLIEKKYEKNPAVLADVTFKVKYEGGLFGYSRKEEGTIRFDDANFRLIFFNQENKERFSIPYKSIVLIYPHAESVQSTTGKVVQNVPLPGAGIAGMFIKDKKRYMVVNFEDSEFNRKELINFKMESWKLLEKAIETLGNKAEMQERGEAFYRPLKPAAPGN